MRSPFDAIRVDLRPEFRSLMPDPDDELSEADFAEAEPSMFDETDTFFDLSEIWCLDRVKGKHTKHIFTKVWFYQGGFAVLKVPFNTLRNLILEDRKRVMRENLLTMYN